MRIEIILDRRLFKEDFLNMEVKRSLAATGQFIADKYNDKLHRSRRIFCDEAFSDQLFICEDLYDGRIKFSIRDDLSIEFYC